MGTKDGNSDNERLLAQILEQFNKEDKERLALRLVQELGLNEYGKNYSDQIKTLLDRPLTTEEWFRLGVLYRIRNYHASGGAGASDGEEEE